MYLKCSYLTLKYILYTYRVECMIQMHDLKLKNVLYIPSTRLIATIDNINYCYNILNTFSVEYCLDKFSSYVPYIIKARLFF